MFLTAIVKDIISTRNTGHISEDHSSKIVLPNGASDRQSFEQTGLEREGQSFITLFHGEVMITLYCRAYVLTINAA